MIKQVEIKLNIEIPEYEDMKAAIKRCKDRWDKDNFQYMNEVTYTHNLLDFPGGLFRIYASEDTGFKPVFDEMHGRYVDKWKLFELNKNGYKELVEYIMDRIQTSVKVW